MGIWAVRLGLAEGKDMATAKIMEAVRKLNKNVLALGSKQLPGSGDSSPAGEGQLGSGKTQPKKASMFGVCGVGATSSWLVPLLTHINLLLVLYGGASLATAARLKWDPSTYIAVRELLPVEYVAMVAGVAAGGVMLLLLPHFAAAALLASRVGTRKILLLVYAGAMLVLVLCELVVGAWLARRLWLWLDTKEAQQLFNIIELRKKFVPALQFFGRWFEAPLYLDKLIKEAEEDAPRNLYVAAAAVVVLALLQPLAIVLALCEARRHCVKASGSGNSEKAPLEAVDKNKDLVVV